MRKFCYFLDHVVVCAGEKQTITCPGVATLNIANADYGYDSSSGCPGSTESAPCQANGVYPVVKSACQGQASCLLQSDGQEFGGMCPGKDNFLKVGYSCQNEDEGSSSSSSPPPATSSQPSAGKSSCFSIPFWEKWCYTNAFLTIPFFTYIKRENIAAKFTRVIQRHPLINCSSFIQVIMLTNHHHISRHIYHIQCQPNQQHTIIVLIRPGQIAIILDT